MRREVSELILHWILCARVWCGVNWEQSQTHDKVLLLLKPLHESRAGWDRALWKRADKPTGGAVSHSWSLTHYTTPVCPQVYRKVLSSSLLLCFPQITNQTCFINIQNRKSHALQRSPPAGGLSQTRLSVVSKGGHCKRITDLIQELNKGWDSISWL